MEYNTDHFLSMLAKMNISLSDKQLQQFMTYYEMLIEKNKVMNLTAITDPNNVVTRFEYDGYSRLTDSYYMDPDLKKVMLQRNIYHLGK